IWRGGEQGEAELLASCYRTSFALAIENGCRHLAYPAISCGVYGYPMKAAAEIALRTLANELSQPHEAGEFGGPMTVTFVLFGKDAYETWKNVAEATGLA
ncbi:MAG: macro domain-containing protein, partial [Phycisphaerae bacterium]